MAKSKFENVWLTDKVVRDLPLPDQGYVLVRDQPDPRGKQGWTSGFGIRITAAGVKSFVLNYRERGTERRMTVGSWPTWSVEAARAEARELKQRIDRGEDPLAELRAERDAETVADFAETFQREHVERKRPSSQRDYKAIVETIIKPALGKKQVASVTTEDVERIHREISKRAPYRANRVLAVASKMFSFAVKKKLRTDNPCKGIEHNPEESRERYLTAAELALLTKALADHPDQQAANILRLCLLSGCRRGEAQAAKWEQIDFERGTWTKRASATKQAKKHKAPLSKPALSLLSDLRRKRDGESPYVFPGRDGPDTHRVELKRDWADICKAAKITGLRMHDLRHSFASELVSSGHSLPVIGALLGHAQVATTQRYAHLYDDVQRAAVDKVGARMVGLVAKRPGKRRLAVVR